MANLDKIEVFTDSIPSILRDSINTLNDTLQAYIQSEMNINNKAKTLSSRSSKSVVVGNFNKTNKLRIVSGAGSSLAFSFDMNSPESTTKFTVANGKIKGKIGTKKIYAGIHETGGFIASKGRMHKFFWAMYYESKLPFFKTIALSVMKKGGVNIKARPFFNPAMKNFKSSGFEIWFDWLIREMNIIWNKVLK